MEQELKLNSLGNYIDDCYAFTNENDASPFVPVSVDLLSTKFELPFDLYCLINQQQVLYKDKNTKLMDVSLENLKKKSINVLYVRKIELPKFLLLLENHLADYMMSSLTVADKTRLVRSAAIHMIKELFDHPSPEEFKRASRMAQNLAKFILTEKFAYQHLINLENHDEYTFNHSVGVCCLAVELAYSMGVTNPNELQDIAVAGLLHDIGKAKIPWDVINKKGTLNNSEWNEMQKHAMYGFSLVRSDDTVELRSKMAILQHHETPGGKGYPAGLEGSDLDVMTKVITICDIFNALTSNRSYSEARSYFDALHLIKNNLIEKVDPKLFINLVKIHGENYSRAA